MQTAAFGHREVSREMKRESRAWTEFLRGLRRVPVPKQGCKSRLNAE